ncbi:glycogen debranching N-terminal domain-containing protein [Arthrobacter mobilis]|uniref:Amylo-alpha-1,6-glucosidase n=1 Tax=Arthrobacter mobilis TaxID=2724944 RepID=A0A7X6HDG0_9MICC|nr:glycogen debranching N-terminal domain-containing protein [Arthrobacter mobilis]NKX54123.1 amylo-alpha-1,6-glucosidase [Arthrobacter mobilis]
MPADHEPYLHHLAAVVAAPLQTWSEPQGQIRGHGAQGVYFGEERVLARCLLRVNGTEPEWVSTQVRAAGAAEYIHAIRMPGQDADPVVWVIRTRTAAPGRLTESLSFESGLSRPVRLAVQLELVADSSSVEQVRHGIAFSAGGVAPEGSSWHWRDPSTTASLTAAGAGIEADGSLVLLNWTVELPPQDTVELGWSLDLADDNAPLQAAAGRPLLTPAVAGEPRLQRLMSTAISDLNSLRMADILAPEDAFVAAGAPWYLTLYGRDSLIAARMLLPVNQDLAAGTLRALAARQGSSHDLETVQEPGKIVHEVRRQFTQLPPVYYDYYGSMDATALWVCLLHDTWRAGLPDAEVADLLPHLEAALAWLRDYGDPDGDGFLEHLDDTGNGAAHHGWKESPDAIRWHDGTPAKGPLVLPEIQAYAHEAALCGAALLEHFRDPDAARQWLTYAAELKDRFHEQFWCSDDFGPYPALALDANKQPVDGIGSNMGHLLGTGLLDEDETAAVVGRLMHPALFSGYGIRTLSTTNAAYWPGRTYAGAVWTHDSAWTVMGMLRSGFADEAALLASGLLNAAEGFTWRLPAMFSGHSTQEVWPPVPHPAATRPQAWAAASAVPIALALGGFNALG